MIDFFQLLQNDPSVSKDFKKVLPSYEEVLDDEEELEEQQELEQEAGYDQEIDD